MAQTVIDHLNAWHHPCPIPYPSIYPNSLRTAITQQASIDWKSSLEGFWSHKWLLHQQEYILSIKCKRSSLLWVSKTQRRIWQIAWKLWKQCNTVLYSNVTSIHQYETDLLDDEIHKEWSHRHRLPSQYNHLFRGSLDTCLSNSVSQKCCLLASMWAEQEARLQERDDRNAHIVNIFERWKATSKSNTM